MWYGPIEIVHNITIKEIENNVPVVYNQHIKLASGYGAVTSFENYKKETPFDTRRSDKLEYIFNDFYCCIYFYSFCFDVY